MSIPLKPPGLLKQLACLAPSQELKVQGLHIHAFEIESSKGKSRCVEFLPESEPAGLIVGMHGNTGSMNDLAASAFYLASKFGYRVALLEAPLHGLSPRSDIWNVGEKSLQTETKCIWFRETLKYYLTQVARKKQAVMLVHSMGGEVSLRTELYHLEAQEKVIDMSAFVLINPLLPSFSAVEPPGLWVLQSHFPKSWVKAFGRRCLPIAYRHLFYNFSMHEDDPEVQDWLHANLILFTQGDWQFHNDFIDMFQTDVKEVVDLMRQGETLVNTMQKRWAQVGGFKKPVLWFCDLKDECVSAEHQKSVAEVFRKEFAIKNLAWCETAEAGHMLPVTHAAWIADKTHAFIQNAGVNLL